MNESQKDYSGKSKKVFLSADSNTQGLIKKILHAERECMHMSRRHEIFQNLVKIIKENVK
jgi:hypothetical protein